MILMRTFGRRGQRDRPGAVTARRTGPAGPVPFPWGMVMALALAQLVGWGTLYYAFAILMEPMGIEFAWSKAAINGALSLGIAVTGLASFSVGSWIDRHGGRTLMALGALFGAVLLVLWSQITELWQLYAICAGLGLAGAMVLYEPAFAVVTRALPADYRRAITTITLLGGLASTVFIPLTHVLVDAVGWRLALLALAAIELALCAGIPWLVLGGYEGPPPAQAPREPHGPASVVRRAMRHPTFWLLIVSYVTFALFYTALLFNLLPILHAHGFTTAEAVAVYALIGPAQVAGRIALLVLERFLTVTIAGLAGTLLPVSALVALSLSQPGSLLVFAFAVAFGAGMGIKTIVQATAAPEFLGREGYGALQGAIVLPVYAAQAIAPFAAALIWQAGGHEFLERVFLLSAVASAGAFAVASLSAPKLQSGGLPSA